MATDLISLGYAAEVDAVVVPHGPARWTTLNVVLDKGLWKVTKHA